MSTYAVGDRGMVTYVINGTEGAVGPCASKLLVAKDIDYRALTDCTASRRRTVHRVRHSRANVEARRGDRPAHRSNLHVRRPPQLGESFMIGDPAEDCVRNSSTASRSPSS